LWSRATVRIHMEGLFVLALCIGSVSTLNTVVSQKRSWSTDSKNLAEIVCEADFALGGDQCGSLLWLEHVNLVVGERALAEKFYFEQGLGCTRDPSKPGGSTQTTGTMWANIGWQQFHLAETAHDEPPQAVRGALGLVLPKAAEACSRLERLAQLEPSIKVERHDDQRFTVSCPWGNIFHCYDIEYQPVKANTEKTKLPKMASIHAAAHTTLRVRGGPGIRFLLLRCSEPHLIAQHYKHFLGQSVYTQQDSALVATGTGPTHFVFQFSLPDSEADARMAGVHACVYLDNFSDQYTRLQEFVFTNPRFVHLDTCDTLEEALASRTFRFAFPGCPNLEHEARSLSHFSFLKQIQYDGAPSS